jgi:hypothetical protein
MQVHAITGHEQGAACRISVRELLEGKAGYLMLGKGVGHRTEVNGWGQSSRGSGSWDEPMTGAFSVDLPIGSIKHQEAQGHLKRMADE